MGGKLEHAKRLAARGFRVFPLVPGEKRPAFPGWQELASDDPSVVSAWWSENPDFNVGIATGRDLVVLDVDVKNGRNGAAALELLDLIGLPGSFRVRTPSGGTHVYLKHDEAIGNAVELSDYPGIDIRGEGGLVVAPGSTVGGVEYVAVAPDATVEALPDWLAPSLRSNRQRVAKSETPLVDLDQPKNIELAKDYLLHRAPEAIEGAGGDETTYRVAARCRDYGLSEGVVLDLMLEHWNEVKASPPWAPDDLATKVANAFSYASGAWGGQTAEAEFGAVDIDEGEPPARARHSEAPEPGFSERLLCAASLAGKPISERPWHVPGLVPAKTVTLLAGDGGTGKSLLALMLAVATATGREWLGRKVRPGRCLYLSAEDDTDEIHRRLADVQGASFGDLSDLTELHILDLAGNNAVLGKLTQARDGIASTALYREVLDWARRERPALIVLDTLADVFGGDEIVRVQARQFVGLLRHLALESGAAVLVLAHPSLTGLNSGEGTSGSTGWSNSVRSRLYFERIKDKGVELDPDRRVLRVKKANYGRVGEEIEVRWQNGIFAPLRDGDVIAQAQERHVERVFMQLLRMYEMQGRPVSDARGSNYAPSLFAKESKAEGIRREAFALAMNRLFAKQAIEVVTEGPPSKSRRKLKPVATQGAEYAEDFGE